MRILRASVEHLPLVTSLFDAYRVFYEQASDKIGAQKFLKERIHCLLYTSPSPRDQRGSRMPSSA